jgi:hypothetical protein
MTGICLYFACTVKVAHSTYSGTKRKFQYGSSGSEQVMAFVACGSMAPYRAVPTLMP